MRVSRRGLLTAGVGTAGSLAVASVAPGWVRLLSAPRTTAGTKMRPSVEGLTRHTFEPLVGSRFRLVPDAGRAEGVVLGQVIGHPVRPLDPPDIEGEAFSLLFTGRPAAGRPPLAQGIHAVEHPDLGAIPLFVVPVGLPRPMQHYEVIVNRRSASSEPETRRSRGA